MSEAILMVVMFACLVLMALVVISFLGFSIAADIERYRGYKAQRKVTLALLEKIEAINGEKKGPSDE